jgi:hypothetical protein
MASALGDSGGSVLGTLLVLGLFGGVAYLIFMPSQGMGFPRSSAPARKAKRRTRRPAAQGRAGKTYRYWADIINRDLDAGDLTPGEVDESLRHQYEEDQDEFKDLGIKNASEFVTGVRNQL